MTTLGDVPGLRTIQTGPFGTQLKAGEYDASGSGAPVVSVGEIREGFIRIKPDTPRVGPEVQSRLNHFMLDERDVVVSRKGAVDRSAWISQSYGPLFLGSDAIAVRFDDPETARFYSYVLQERTVRGWLVRHAPGTTMLSMNGAVLGSVPVPVLHARQMNQIIELLGVLDDKIAANHLLLTTAFDLGTSMARARASRARPLAEVADIVMGSSPPGEYLNEEGEGVPFFQGVRDFGSVYPKPRVSTSSPIRIAPEGATLFAVRAPVGAINLAAEDVCIGRGLASISSAERPATLHFTLSAFPEIWNEHQGGGTVFASINRNELRSALIPMPQDGTDHLEQHLAALLEHAVQAERETACLAATRDELLPLLMSGKITVKDAEKTVEEVV